MKQLRKYGIIYQLQAVGDNVAYLLMTEVKSIHERNNKMIQVKKAVRNNTIELDGLRVSLDEFKSL